MILLPLKEKMPGSAEGARRAALVGRAQRLGGVLDQRNAVALRRRPGSDRCRRSGRRDAPAPRPWAAGRRAPCGQRLGQQGGIHVPRAALAVDEGGPAAEVDDRVGAGREGERGDQHLVARPDAGQEQRQVQRAVPRRAPAVRRADGRGNRARRRPRGGRAARSSWWRRRPGRTAAPGRTCGAGKGRCGWGQLGVPCLTFRLFRCHNTFQKAVS